jgi:hypothetical protein
MFAFLLIGSCHHKQEKQNKNELDNLTNKDQNIEDREEVKIALSLCAERWKHQYTDSNSTYFHLDQHHNMGCFVFSSLLVCGGAMGSCGENIQIIKQTDMAYEVAFETCGFNAQPCVEAYQNINAFTYETREGITYKVQWDGSSFTQKPIRINNLDYDKIRLIASAIGEDIRTFTHHEPNDKYTWNTVKVEKIQLGYGNYGKLYSVQTAPNQHFIFDNDSIVLRLSDVHSVEIMPQATRSFYDIKTYDSDHYVMTRDTSYYTPVFYTYSAKKKKYIIK